MITPMTKLTMLIYHRDYNKFLNDLREHGVVHVHAKKETLQDETMKAKMTEVKHINNVVKSLVETHGRASENVHETHDNETHVRVSLHGEELINHIDEQYAKMDSIQQEIAALQKDDNVYAQWGHFPEERLRQIQDNNWDVRFFTVPSKNYDNAWEEEFNAFLVNELSGFNYFTTITSKGKEVNIDAEPFHFPSMTKSEIENKMEELKKELPEKIESKVSKILEAQEKDRKSFHLSKAQLLVALLTIAVTIVIGYIQLAPSRESQPPASSQLSDSNQADKH